MRLWLESVLDEPLLDLAPASADASFRRYFRARTAHTSYVVMDAPPDKEPLDQFIAIDRALAEQGVHVPAIISQNIDDGFLLLEDLGNRNYLNELHNSTDQLYGDAIASLILIQLGTFEQSEFDLPVYTPALLTQELNLFDDWYLQRHLNVQLSEAQRRVWLATRDFLVRTCLEQPVVWVHRDYHSRNLMVSSEYSPAVIDFQDMVFGPIAYDLASLFKDCYIEWPRSAQHRWLNHYLAQANEQLPLSNLLTLKQLIRWVDLTGLQRHLKVMGIFCRLNYRDGKSHYIDDLALVKKYLFETLELYPELHDFSQLFNTLHMDMS